MTTSYDGAIIHFNLNMRHYLLFSLFSRPVFPLFHALVSLSKFHFIFSFLHNPYPLFPISFESLDFLILSSLSRCFLIASLFIGYFVFFASLLLLFPSLIAFSPCLFVLLITLSTSLSLHSLSHYLSLCFFSHSQFLTFFTISFKNITISISLSHCFSLLYYDTLSLSPIAFSLSLPSFLTLPLSLYSLSQSIHLTALSTESYENNIHSLSFFFFFFPFNLSLFSFLFSPDLSISFYPHLSSLLSFSLCLFPCSLFLTDRL
ncbi:unnamed protein product [Acanthosepion pharaonis]|uniref:Uncharacterized protein n=1 Tax=Acanthosepion pharaonis TaxID=158019 RepID=A0A812DS76_ACAPH|nr:unnamed protein product [Sepia pharaonis]